MRRALVVAATAALVSVGSPAVTSLAPARADVGDVALHLDLMIGTHWDDSGVPWEAGYCRGLGGEQWVNGHIKTPRFTMTTASNFARNYGIDWTFCESTDSTPDSGVVNGFNEQDIWAHQYLEDGVPGPDTSDPRDLCVLYSLTDQPFTLAETPLYSGAYGTSPLTATYVAGPIDLDIDVFKGDCSSGTLVEELEDVNVWLSATYHWFLIGANFQWDAQISTTPPTP